jgi:hypothetical protein
MRLKRLVFDRNCGIDLIRIAPGEGSRLALQRLTQ